MSSFRTMNTNMTAAACSAAGCRAHSASMLSVLLGADVVASIFVVLRLAVRVWVNVLSVVLVRIISGLIAPTVPLRHMAVPQT